MLIRISPYQVYDSLGIINELCSQRVITLESGLSVMCIGRTSIESHVESWTMKYEKGNRESEAT